MEDHGRLGYPQGTRDAHCPTLQMLLLTVGRIVTQRGKREHRLLGYSAPKL